MKRIAIIGACGYVGKAFEEMVKGKYEVVLYDPKLGELSATKEECNKCDLAVISVPTPMSQDCITIGEIDSKDGKIDKRLNVYKCDTSIVEDCVKWLETPVILIKSTVEVGTTERLKAKYEKRIVFSPEYVGEGGYRVTERMKFHTDMGATPFLILGGDKEDCEYIFDILVPILGPEKTYFKTDSKTAEFIKYKENDYFAHKVVWANEFREQADALGVDYYDAWEGWSLDPRVDKMHTAVFKENRGFSGFCLPKDTNGLCYSLIKAGFIPEFQIAMLKKNLQLKQVDDYQEISGKKK